jgi:hypothetical protein
MLFNSHSTVTIIWATTTLLKQRNHTEEHINTFTKKRQYVRSQTFKEADRQILLIYSFL